MSLTSSSLNLATSNARGENPLDKFQSFNCIFTLAALSPSQVNSTTLIDKSSIKHIICRTAGSGSLGVDSGFGKFDYFIDDVIITSVPTLSAATGNTSGTKITFKVFEPYSMGLFMLAMRQAAADAGYTQNFNDAPFVFMIEWLGYVGGKPTNLSDDLTRIIPIKIQKCFFNVGTTGSTYEVQATPYNEFGFKEHIVRTPTDVKISGKKVIDILSYGGESLMDQFTTMKAQMDPTRSGTPGTPIDEYRIVFPENYNAVDGYSNEIAQANLYIDLSNNGVQKFLNPADIFLDGKEIYEKAPFKLEAERVWHFTQGVSIPDIITEVIIRSDYITRQVIDRKIQTDANGMIKWFKIEAMVEDKGFEPRTGKQRRLITYRVFPYKVHIHRFLPPGQKPEVGFENLKNTVVRVYDYMYTGNNTEVLDVAINFNMAYFAPIPSDRGFNVGQANPGQAGIQAGLIPPVNSYPETQGVGGVNPLKLPSSPTVPILANTDQSLLNSLTTGSSRYQALQQATPAQQLQNQAEILPADAPVAQPQFFFKARGGDGAGNEKTSKVKTMQYLLTQEGDMTNLEIDIMGDPYYIPSSGMGNQRVPSKGTNLLKDGSMNYQDGETHIIFNFRTPIDLNPSTGLYDFAAGIDMWSGLYQVTKVESKFNANKFTQHLSGIRLRAQLGGQDAQSIFLQETKGQATNLRGNNPNYTTGLVNPDTEGRGDAYQGDNATPTPNSGETPSPADTPMAPAVTNIPAPGQPGLPFSQVPPTSG